jgi:hypothetical protein
MYKVFTRNWYKVENGKIVPDYHARKTILAYVNTEEEARAICKEYNDTHAPGVKSRKAEYTSDK